MSDTMLREAIDAISKGQRVRARDLLTRLLRTDQANAEYWLWMSSVVETQNERVYCLESALKLDPSNSAARQGLILLGARKPGDDVRPVAPPRRSVASEVEDVEIPKSGFQKMWEKPKLRVVFIGGVILSLAALVGLIVLLGNFSEQRRLSAIWTANAPVLLGPGNYQTEGPTPTSVVRSPTPTFRGPTPLWMFLEATYTPMPPMVATPDTNYEDFKLGMRAYSNGDYPKMLTYMLVASGYEPESANLKYYVGEAYRLNEQYDLALNFYNRAIELDPDLAAAYLGKAQVERLVKEEASTLDDLSQALELDPNMGSAYLERANYYIQAGNLISATVDLDSAKRLMPEAPLLYLYRSQIALAQGDSTSAVIFAEYAYSLDITQLPIYLGLAEAYMAAGDYEQAQEALGTYLVYVDNKPDGYIMMGRIRLMQADYEGALEMFDQALEIDRESAQAYYYRGITFMELGDGQDAVNDLVKAQKQDLKNFQINLDLGRALMLAERNVDARDQFDATYKLADSELEFATVYYYRAQAFENLRATTSAGRDWQSLLMLANDDIPEEWRVTAREHLDIIYPPTPTDTPTPSPATLTPTPTATSLPKTATPTPTRTPTRKP